MSPVLDCDDRRTGSLPVAFLNPSPSAPPKFSRHQAAMVLSGRHNRPFDGTYHTGPARTVGWTLRRIGLKSAEFYRKKA